MTKINHAVIIGGLAAIALVGIVVLVGLGRPVPDVLSTVAVVAVSALAGLAIPVVAGGVAAAATAAQTVASYLTPNPPAAAAAAAPGAAQDVPGSPQRPETVVPPMILPPLPPMAA